MMMTILWVALGIAVLGFFATRIVWSYDGGWPSELGFVSHQWVVRHSVSRASDSQR